MMRLVIEPVGLHWLYNAEPTDLCAHGGVRVTLGDKVIFEAGCTDDGYTLSTAALHLLRTIDRDYLPGEAPSAQLFPCCGNMMVLDQGLAEVVNLPCPNGIDWTIRHRGQSVQVDISEQVRLDVEEAEWKIAVRTFSEQVRAFYFAVPREVSDGEDAKWHPHFVAEWDARQEATK